ncbi:MAG: TauD/TfdA family dioxygenase [Alphaproteobacteria bacterium]|nr:TauD/TfdA family dioxygenase [Alphaproteobacteria bacterium]
MTADLSAVTTLATSTAEDDRPRIGADPDMFCRPGDPTLSSVRADGDAALVTWSDGRTGRFHWVWLRDNCLCSECCHPAAWEKMHDITALDLDVRPAAFTLTEDGALRIVWPGLNQAGRAHKTRFPAAWLRRFCYDDWAEEERAETIEPWTAAIGNRRPEIKHQAVMESDDGLRTWLRHLRRYGFCIVKGAPRRPDTVTQTARRIGFLRQTHFGVDYTVISKPNPENVAYTPIYVAPHTDLSYTQTPPGLQFLHCIDFEATGGESILVDGFAVAERLRREDPESFDLLARIPADNRFHDHDYDMRCRKPVIELDEAGRVAAIRTNRQGEGPLGLRPDLVRPYYKAKQAFALLTRDRSMTLRFRLEPGDIMSFHNHRVLHGREPYDPGSGKRRLQGCYVDCDQAWSRLRVLEAAAKAH